MILAGLAVVIIAALAAILISRSSGDSGATGDQLYGIFSGAPLDEADLNKMVVSKVSSVRLVLSWSTIEANRGSYNWEDPDQTIGSLAVHGMEAVPFVYGSPSFVSPNPTTPPIDTAADRAAWVGFLKAVVDALRPRGGVLGRRLQAGVRRRRETRSGHRLADLERAQPSPLLHLRLARG